MAGQWWKSPQLRVIRDAEEERHATWLEVFFDLVFVVAVAELAEQLNNNISIKGAVQFTVLFIIVWWSWIGAAYYATRFDTDDTGHRLLTLAQMFAIAAMAVNIHKGLASSSAGFALSFVAVRFFLIIEYFRAERHIPEARKLTRRYERGFSIAAVIWLISAFVPIPLRFALWGLGIVVDFATPLLAGQLHSEMPPHTSHLPERFGLFTIIVLGESVARAIRGLAYQQWSILPTVTAALGLSIAFSIWWLYFDSITGAAIRTAIRYGRVTTYLQWLNAHLLLAAGITAIGVSLEQAVLRSQLNILPLSIRWLICIPLATCLVSLMIIHLTSTGETCTRLRGDAGGIYRGIAAIIVMALVAAPLMSIVLMVILNIICAVLVILDFYERARHGGAE